MSTPAPDKASLPDRSYHWTTLKAHVFLGALADLGRVGYDPVYGARPLKRAVQRYLQDPLAEKLLAGEIPDGSTVKIDEGDGELKMVVG